MIVKSPWVLMLPRRTKPPKKYAMSLNNYRNSHHRANHEAKLVYSKLIAPQLKKLPVYTGPIKLTLTINPPSRRRYDLDNYGGVTAKFFQDALVEQGCIVDDDSTHIVELKVLPGKVSPKTPGITIQITKED